MGSDNRQSCRYRRGNPEMHLLMPVLAAVLGMGVVCALVPVLLRFGNDLRLGQRAPDFHHTHKVPVPRLGGLALALSFVVVEIFIALASPQERSATPARNVVVLGSLTMFALGFVDDLRPLGAKRKLAVQVLIALGVWYMGVGVEAFRLPFGDKTLELQLWAPLVTVGWLVAFTNLVNLIDGVDGLAGGICLMLMGLLAYIGYQNGQFTLLTAGMAGALLGFLRHNYPPAQIYLGDGGAYFLGFQLGLISLVNSQKGTVVAALIAPLFVLGVPIVDAALAILRRGLRGLPVFRPDRRHIHHRLLRYGLSRRQVVLAMYGLTFVFLVLGLVAFWSSARLIPVIAGFAGMLVLMCAGNLRLFRAWPGAGRVVGSSLEIRREVQSALCLTRWLALEGRRCSSVDVLWEDLVFVAGKLGFTSVRLSLEGSERVWQAQKTHSDCFFKQNFQGGRLGILELGSSLAQRSTEMNDGRHADPQVSDESRSEILAELVAEGWLKALDSLQRRRGLGSGIPHSNCCLASGSSRFSVSYPRDH